MDTLVDEFDPIRSLDAFGMHVIEDNPGVKEALSAREHSIAIRLNSKNDVKHDVESAHGDEAKSATITESGQETAFGAAGESNAPQQKQKNVEGVNAARQSERDDQNSWPYTAGERKTSKEAWWRTLGRGRKRDVEGK